MLPAAAKAAAESQAVFAPLNAVTGLGAATGRRLADLRVAMQAQRKVQITCEDLKNKPSGRTLRPLGLFLLWQSLNSGGLVRDQGRLSQLSGGPDSNLRGAHGWV